MGWTKRQYINDALTELGLADYVFDLSPAELQSALRRLDSMMAQWEVRGIRVSYPSSSTPSGSDIDAVTSVPEAANTAIITNLAKLLAPSYGKSLSQETMATARKAIADLTTFTARIPEMQFPSTLPRGAGAKSWRGGYEDPFFPSPSDPLLAGPDSEIDFD
jgi:hypothetical protein